MKLSGIILVILLNIVLMPELRSQNCKKFHLYSTCMQYVTRSYKMDSQSRSNVIGFGDKLIYNVIFYGEREYKLLFCATDLFNPVKFVMTDDLTKEVIYDNENDTYSSELDLKIESTRRIMIEVSVLARQASRDVIDNYFGCVGLMLYWKPDKESLRIPAH
jgi:hypothetical protein